MAHDTHANDTASEPDSLGNDDISYSDWQSPAGAMIGPHFKKYLARCAGKQLSTHRPKIFDDIIAAHDSPLASVSLCLS